MTGQLGRFLSLSAMTSGDVSSAINCLSVDSFLNTPRTFATRESTLTALHLSLRLPLITFVMSSGAL
jgi:hypothetical protein